MTSCYRICCHNGSDKGGPGPAVERGALQCNTDMGAGKAISAAAKAAARNKAIRGLAVTAGAAAAKKAGPIAQQRYGAWRDRRIDRDRAIKLARQLQGRYSQDTIIAGEPHFVVWKDGAPIQAFPHVDDLASRPELKSFDAGLAHEPPPVRRRARPRTNGQE
jgi:hypothetical protein